MNDPDTFEWKIISAVRESKRGIIMASKEIEGVKIREISKGAMEIKFKRNDCNWRIVTVYS